MPQQRRAKPGQSLLLLAFVGTALMLMVGLVVDAGFSYVVRRQTQNAADAASRAGANYLAQSYTDAQIQNIITSIGNQNNCNSGAAAPCTWTASYIDTSGTEVGTVGSGTLPSTAAGVKVAPQKTYASFLTSLLGWQSMTVSASASAIYGTLGAASCSSMLPVAMNGDTGTGFADWTLNACVLIKDDAGTPGGGSFGWVDFTGGGGGTSELAGWMNSYATSGNTGCTGTITVGTASANIETETGNKASLQSAVLAIINSATHNEITIPIYDDYGRSTVSPACTDNNATGSLLCYRTKGFGRFKITDAKIGNTAEPSPDNTACSQTLFGTSNGILGQFVGFVDPNGQISATAAGPAKVVNVIN